MSLPRFLADEDLRFEIVRAVRRLDVGVSFPTVVELGRVIGFETKGADFSKRKDKAPKPPA